MHVGLHNLHLLFKWRIYSRFLVLKVQYKWNHSGLGCATHSHKFLITYGVCDKRMVLHAELPIQSVEVRQTLDSHYFWTERTWGPGFSLLATEAQVAGGHFLAPAPMAAFSYYCALKKRVDLYWFLKYLYMIKNSAYLFCCSALYNEIKPLSLIW